MEPKPHPSTTLLGRQPMPTLRPDTNGNMPPLTSTGSPTQSTHINMFGIPKPKLIQMEYVHLMKPNPFQLLTKLPNQTQNGLTNSTLTQPLTMLKLFSVVSRLTLLNTTMLLKVNITQLPHKVTVKELPDLLHSMLLIDHATTLELLDLMYLIPDTPSHVFKMLAPNKPSEIISIPTILMVFSKDTTTSGPTRTNLTVKLGSTLRITNGNKESVSLPEDSLNLLLDTDLEVLPSLSLVELVEVFIPKLLMLELIFAVKLSKT